MLYDLNIRDYANTLFQPEGADGYAMDSAFHLVAQSQPYPATYEIKDPYKNDWFDEDGDDEYTEELHWKSFQFNVKFFIKAGGSNARAEIKSEWERFLGYIMSAGEFRYYDGWQQIGFRGVRFVKAEVETKKITEDDAWFIYVATFKVNDPHSVSPSAGRLV